jgi:PST family polysaccharide transporter
LGGKWTGAANIFKVLSVTAFIQPVASTVGLVLVSLGQSKRYLKWGIANSVLTVFSFVVGLPWGAMGVATAYTIANYILLWPTLWYSFRESPFTTRDFFSAIFWPMIASLCMGLAIFPCYLSLRDQSAIMVVGVSFALGLLVYFSGLVLIPGGRLILRELFSYALLLLRKETS